MTPQPRHFDTARDIIDKYHDFRHPLQVEDMARAIAEAENRAAWDGREFGSRETGHHLCGSPVKCAEVYREFVAKYGPRPTTENQP